MKEFWKRLLEKIKTMSYRRVCMACLSVVLALVLSITTLFFRMQTVNIVETMGSSPYRPVSSEESSSEATSSEEVSSEAPSLAPTVLTALLGVSSVEEDLFIQVKNAAGGVISGKRIALIVTFPNGQTSNYTTGTDGSCYLKNLVAGEYRV